MGDRWVRRSKCEEALFRVYKSGRESLLEVEDVQQLSMKAVGVKRFAPRKEETNDGRCDSGLARAKTISFYRVKLSE